MSLPLDVWLYKQFFNNKIMSSRDVSIGLSNFFYQKNHAIPTFRRIKTFMLLQKHQTCYYS